MPAALTLLAAEPFGYTKNLGFSPRETQGNVAAELNLKLPLIDDPDLGQIKLAVGADVTNLFIAGAFLGGDVTGGSLRLDVSEKGMDIAARRRSKASTAGSPGARTSRPARPSFAASTSASRRCGCRRCAG